MLVVGLVVGDPSPPFRSSACAEIVILVLAKRLHCCRLGPGGGKRESGRREEWERLGEHSRKEVKLKADSGSRLYLEEASSVVDRLEAAKLESCLILGCGENEWIGGAGPLFFRGLGGLC